MNPEQMRINKPNAKAEASVVKNKVNKDLSPDNLTTNQEVTVFKQKIKNASKELGPKFFDTWNQAVAEIKQGVSENDLNKSPYYHALLGSSGFGKDSLAFNKKIDEQVKEVIDKHFKLAA